MEEGMNKRLLNKLGRIQKKFKEIGPIMRGSVVILKNKCANKNCKCQKDKTAKHPAYYFSVNMNNKTKLIYIGSKKLKIAEEYSKNYLKLKKIINEMTLINLEIVKLLKI